MATHLNKQQSLAAGRRPLVEMERSSFVDQSSGRDSSEQFRAFSTRDRDGGNAVSFVVLLIVLLLLSGALSIPFFGALERSTASAVRIGAIASGLYTPVMAVAYALTFFLLLPKLKLAISSLFQRWELIALLFMVAASVAWSVNIEVSFRRAIALYGTTMVAIAISVLMSQREAWRLLAMSLALMTIASLAAVVIMPTVAIHHDIHEGAWRGLLSHKNNFGWLMAAAIVVLAEGARSRFLPRIPALLAAALALGCLVMSHSATALIALVGAAGALTVCTAFRGSKWARLLVWALIGCVAAIGLTFSDELFTRILEMLGRTSTLSGRTSLWSALGAAVLERPLLGYGYDGFWATSISTTTLERGAFVTGHSHNGYLDLTLSLGVIGLLLYLMLAFLATRRVYLAALSGSRYAAMLFALSLLIHTVGFSGGVILDGNSIFWPIVLLALFHKTQAAGAASIATQAVGEMRTTGHRFKNLLQ